MSANPNLNPQGNPDPLDPLLDMETGVALDGIDLLLQMAKTGEIDPWDIDIGKVADQYLQAVAELKESDLKITGKTLLYLAILLRMKSDALAGINYLNPPEENEFLDELLEPDFMDGGRAIQPKFSFRSLDEVIKRRTSTKQPRIRTVTLNDLIRELKRYEELEKRRSLKEKVERTSDRRMRDYAEFTADDIEEMAHEEFIEDTILHLRNILERILIQQEQVSLSEIIEQGKIDKISAFLALLFLTARSNFAMQQEEFYGELYVIPDEQPASYAQTQELANDDVEESGISDSNVD
jgi:segregation and condensation protein A